MLQALAKVQIPASELAQMSSVAHIGTKNNNMVKNLSKRPIPEELKIEVEKLNSIKVRKRMKKEVQEEVSILYIHTCSRLYIPQLTDYILVLCVLW